MILVPPPPAGLHPRTRWSNQNNWGVSMSPKAFVCHLAWKSISLRRGTWEVETKPATLGDLLGFWQIFELPFSAGANILKKMWTIRFLDLLKTDYCESICQGCFNFHWSRTKVRGSKTIRYRPSLNHKPCQRRLFLSGGFASSNWLSKGPKSPDDRMLKDTSYPVRMHGSAGSTKIPTIPGPLLLHAFKRAPECVQIFEQTNRRFYVMNVGHPSPVYFFSAGTM